MKVLDIISRAYKHQYFDICDNTLECRSHFYGQAKDVDFSTLSMITEGLLVGNLDVVCIGSYVDTIDDEERKVIMLNCE